MRGAWKAAIIAAFAEIVALALFASFMFVWIAIWATS